MKEYFLHFIWKHSYFNQTNLLTESGESVVVLSPGYENNNEGPDFSNAVILIDNKEWHGHVEIHLSSSDWVTHHHSSNPLYRNVILHVVYNDNKSIRYATNEKIPTIELKDRIPLHLIKNHKALSDKKGWIPCTGILHKYIDRLKWLSWSERLLAERMNEKILRIKDIYDASKGDWEVTLYKWMAYGFGLRVNADSFLQLANYTPFNLVNKYRSRPEELAALLYGQAGMLSIKCRDSWPKSLYERYLYLIKKHDIKKSSYILWKNHRMRPVALPSLRISLFINLMIRSVNLFDEIINQKDINEAFKLFNISGHKYWEDRSMFDRIIKPRSVKLGKTFKQIIFINVIIPFIYFYGHEIGNEKYKEKSILWLQSLPPEKNKIMRLWESEQIKIENAADSQALYYLKKNYCDSFRCLSCHFGHQIIQEKR